MKNSTTVKRWDRLHSEDVEATLGLEMNSAWEHMIPLDKLEQVKILVVGDYMLDKYCYGTIERLSPEAPVPVLRVQEEKCVPGGAANVVNNLVALGCKVRAFGLVGNDKAGNTLIDMLSHIGVCTNNLYRANSHRTLIKMRLVANNSRQIARLDYNENNAIPEIDNLYDRLRDDLNGCNIAILSDYGKGFCSSDTVKFFIGLCSDFGIPIIVDPKGTDWAKYYGATWVTPNFNEFVAMIGKAIPNSDDAISAYITNICKDYKFGNILVTRSEQGMTLYDGTVISHIRAKSKDVFDVSGAGDTVVAVLGALLGAGCEKSIAVDTANLAGGIVVSKSGTAIVAKDELVAEIRIKHIDRISLKIMDWNTLFTQVARWKADGKTIALANGCFDIFHKGHASLIHTASQCADKLIIAINTDDTIRKLKGEGRPINRELDRAYVLASLENVDAVVIFRQDTPEELLSYICPDVLVKGGEYAIEQVPGRQYAKYVKLADYIDGYSTTAILNKSKNKNLS